MADDNEVFFFKADDPAIAAAAQKAQESFRWFWYQVASDFNRIVPATAFSMVKAAFSNDFSNPDETVEHMFVSDIYFDGVDIHGVLRSSPNWVTSLRDGDEVSFSPQRVGDWLCQAGDTVYGGFAVQVIRSQMSEEERKSHDDAWGLPFPDVGTVHIPERSSEFEEMITVHLRNALAEDPGIVRTTDRYLRTPLHNESLYGRIETAKALLEYGADPNAKCERGWIPMDYAKAVGWEELVALLNS